MDYSVDESISSHRLAQGTGGASHAVTSGTLLVSEKLTSSSSFPKVLMLLEALTTGYLFKLHSS